MTTITKGTYVIKPDSNGIAIIDSSEIALSNDGSAAPAAILLHAGDGAGTDITGAALTIRGGAGTGAGLGGNIVLQCVPHASTGLVENTGIAALTINGDTGRITCGTAAQGGFVVSALASRPSSPVNGMIIYNSGSTNLEAYYNNAWYTLSGTAI